MLIEHKFTIGNEVIPYLIAKDYKSAKNLFVDTRFDRYYIVFDPKIEISQLLERVFDGLNYHSFALSVSEYNKSFSRLNNLLEELIESSITRNSCLVAVGGGIIGNMVGLAAALLYRGISFIHMPTTTIAAADSVLSLKQAINSSMAKNMIGTFYAPEFICTFYPLFKTLPRRDYYAGLVEFVKNVLICGLEHEDFLASYDYQNFNTYEQLSELIRLSLKIKSDLLADDKFEKGRGIIFEYGHTFGHAVEILTKGKINHGESVAFGMLAAVVTAFNLSLASYSDIQKHIELLTFIMPQLSGIIKLEPQKIISIMKNDNKRGYIAFEADSLPLVLIKTSEKRGCHLVNVPKRIIEQSIWETCKIISKWQ